MPLFTQPGSVNQNCSDITPCLLTPNQAERNRISSPDTSYGGSRHWDFPVSQCVFHTVWALRCLFDLSWGEMLKETGMIFTWRGHWVSWSSWGSNCSSWQTWALFLVPRPCLWSRWYGPSRPQTGRGSARTWKPPRRGPSPARPPAPPWKWWFPGPFSLMSFAQLPPLLPPPPLRHLDYPDL